MKNIGIVAIGIAMFSNSALAKEIKICTDSNFWYPFSFEEKGAARGIHIDLVADALKKLGHTAKFSPMPWERCLKADGATGAADAAVSASYKPDRAEAFLYPEDASTESAPCASKSKIMCVSYVVISNSSDKFEFDGDIKKLPQPVRAVQGYSIVKDLEKDGVKAQTARGDLVNVKKLVAEGNGVVVLTQQQASFFLKDKEFAGKIKVQSKPIGQKSYHAIFSKKGSVGLDEAKKIWAEVEKLASDSDYMQGLFKRYE